jgi:hypothetical protein
MGMNSHGMVYYKVGFYMQTNKMAGIINTAEKYYCVHPIALLPV